MTYTVICSVMSFNSFKINLHLIYQMSVQISQIKGPPIMAVVLGATQTPFPIVVADPILITNEEGGVVDKIIRNP